MTPYFGEMLILTLIAICCLRTFFISKMRIDPLALFSLLAVIIMFFQLVNWGVTISSIIVLIITILVFLTNYRSIIRFFNHLYVDSYSLPFFISSCILLALTLAAAVFLTLMRPVLVNPNKYQTIIDKKVFARNSENEFYESTEILQNRTLKLSIYSPNPLKGNQEKDTVVLFVPDKRAGVMAYEPYLVLLSRAGYKVYAADFGFTTVPSDKIELSFIKQQKLFQAASDNPAEYFRTHPVYLESCAREYEILSRIASRYETTEKKFVIVGDGMSGMCFGKIINPARTIIAAFSLNNIPEYKSPGFGFVEQTDPLLAKFKFNLKRDPDFFVPSYAVMKTRVVIEAANDTK